MKTFTPTSAALLLASTAAIAQVETRIITFENEGAILSGTLYLPEGHSGAALPAVVVTGACATVEEQMPRLYAEELVEAVYGGADGVVGLIEIGRAAQAASGQIIPAAGPEGAEGVLMPMDGYDVDPARGTIPEYDNQWNRAIWEGWLTYYPVSSAGQLTQPLAIVHSDAATIPRGVEAFLQGFAGAAMLEMFEAVTQFDFYDKPEDVTRAADTMARHFLAVPAQDS
ncbi:alpha/beta hydrolase [Roseobacter weihaiensis]|uniref:alpha/beta hydrolase n=1 Tax=Roseobacter weihaiensis TaxID=2763262 RepID=UPI001D0A92D7|nr:alpha/beta hydrolase [Roseobacter sp. H9]